MSVWSNATGKPQLSYAERLRNAAKPTSLSTPTNAGAGSTSTGVSSAENVGTDAPELRSQPSTSRITEQSEAVAAPVQGSRAQPSSADLPRELAQSTDAVKPSANHTGDRLEDKESRPDASSTPQPAAVPKPPPVNVWEARKRQLAEKEAEKEKARQQSLAAQRKATAVTSPPGEASAAPSAAVRQQQKAAAPSSAAVDSTSSKAKQSKTVPTPNVAGQAQKSKQDRLTKSGSSSAAGFSDKKTPRAQEAMSATKAQAPTLGKAAPLATSSQTASSPEATAAASSHGKADSSKSKAAPNPISDASGGTISANPDVVPQNSESKGQGSLNAAGSSSTGSEVVDAASSSTKAGDIAVPASTSKRSDAQPRGGARVSDRTAPAASTLSPPSASSREILAGNKTIAKKEAKSGASINVEDAIEKALLATAAKPPSAEEDNAWLARIHLLNGGQNMPKFGDFGPEGEGIGISGGLQGVTASSEAEAQAAKKAERAVAAAWGAGKNVWQQRTQQQRQTQPPNQDAGNDAPALRPPSLAAAPAVDADRNGQAYSIRSNEPTCTVDAEPKVLASESKKKRRASNASRGRTHSVSASRPDTNRSEVPSPPPLGDLNSWPSPLDAGTKDANSSNARAAQNADSIPGNRSTGEKTAISEAARSSTSDASSKAASTSAAAGGNHLPPSSKKGKQHISLEPENTQSTASRAGSKKGSAESKGTKASQNKSEATSKSHANLPPQSQLKKSQQPQALSSSRSGKGASLAPSSGGPAMSSSEISSQASARASASVSASVQEPGKGPAGRAHDAADPYDQAKGTPHPTDAAQGTRNNKSTLPSTSLPPTRGGSRRINGIVSETNGLGSGQNSAAGSPRSRPAHLPATPPPPATFPPRVDTAVAQPMSASSSAQPFGQASGSTSAQSGWHQGGPSSPLLATWIAPTNKDGSHSPRRSIDVGRPGQGIVANGIASGSLSPVYGDSWRGGGTPKRGRGALRGISRGGARGGGRVAAVESFMSPSPSGNRERRAYDGTGPTESPLTNRQYARANAPYPFYQGFAPQYAGEVFQDPSFCFEGPPDSTVLGQMQLYPAPAVQGYYGQSQQPIAAQWTRYIPGAQQPTDLYGASSGLVEMTSQTDTQVPAGTTQQLLGQIEFYFSQRNLQGDFFLRQRMDAQGWVDIAVVASFKRVQQVTTDLNAVKDTLLYSAVLDIDVARMKVRKRFGWEAYVLPQDWKASDAPGRDQGRGNGYEDASNTPADLDAGHLSAQSSSQAFGAHLDAANSATPSKVSTAMSSPPSSFTRASQDEREAAEEVEDTRDHASSTYRGIKSSPPRDGCSYTSSMEDEEMGLGVVAASGFNGTLDSACRKAPNPASSQGPLS